MNLYQIQKRAPTLWKKTVALLVMAIVVSAGYCQTVQAREQFEVRRLRFVQPDVIYFHMIDYERKGTYTGLYNISTGLFTPLTTVSDGEFVPVNSEVTNHPPAFIWKLKDKWVIADQNGAVDSFEQELQGSERILRIFPEKQLAILPDPSYPLVSTPIMFFRTMPRRSWGSFRSLRAAMPYLLPSAKNAISSWSIACHPTTERRYSRLSRYARFPAALFHVMTRSSMCTTKSQRTSLRFSRMEWIHLAFRLVNTVSCASATCPITLSKPLPSKSLPH